MMKVVYLFRSKSQKLHSIENVFNTVVRHLGAEVEKECLYVPEYSVSLRSFLKNYFFCKKIKADVVHITGDIYYAALFFPSKKVVITLHDFVLLENARGIKKYILKFLWYTLPLHFCSRISVISEKVKEDLRNLYPGLIDKVEVIPNPVSDCFYWRRKKVEGNGVPVIFQIGTKENKNLYRVINALIDIPCVLRILGPLSEKQKLYLNKNKICYENFFSVSMEKVVDLYSQSDVVVFASLYEGFGMPIIEAQCMGIPVITSDIEPMKSVAGKNGAIFVNPYDDKDIRNAIIDILRSEKKRREVIQNGFENVKLYSSKIIAERYCKLYKKVIS